MKRECRLLCPDPQLRLTAEEALDEGETEENTVGILKQSLYGTRDAAANFQREVKKMMEKIGYRKSGYNASQPLL